MSTLDFFFFHRMKHKVGESVFSATVGKAKAGTDLPGRFNGLLLCSNGGNPLCGMSWTFGTERDKYLIIMF